MWSRIAKFHARSAGLASASRALLPRGPLAVQVRGALFPPTPYDSPAFTKLFKRSHLMSKSWECLPTLAICVMDIALIVFASVYLLATRVDIDLIGQRKNISRTMDLRSPKVVKLITVTQEYEPWPEMQDVLDRMAAAESERAAEPQKPCRKKRLQLLGKIDSGEK